MTKRWCEDKICKRKRIEKEIGSQDARLRVCSLEMHTNSAQEVMKCRTVGRMTILRPLIEGSKRSEGGAGIEKKRGKRKVFKAQKRKGYI